jgi:ribosomal protein L31
MWWHTVTHGRGSERGNWRMEWVASILQTTSEHGVSSITTADTHTSAASSRLNIRHRRFKWTRPFRRMTISGFCTCAITFQTHSTQSNKVMNCAARRRCHPRGCDVVYCGRRVPTFQELPIHPSSGHKNVLDDGDSRIVRDFGKFLSDYTASLPSRQ